MAGHKQRKLLHAAREESRRFAEEHPSPHVDPGEALQWIVNRVFDMLKHAAHEADSLRDDELEVMTAFGPVANHWLRLEADLRQELGTLAVNVERVGLAERMVRLEEAKVALINRAMMAALREVGVPQRKLKELGPAFRRNLQVLQGGGEGGEPASARPRKVA